MKTLKRLAPLTLLALFGAACSDVEDHDDGHGHDHGQITTMVLNFTPTDGGETLSFTWADPEADGSPVADDILLPDGSDHDHHDAQSYTLDIVLYNELEDPMEDVTPEIEELPDEHQFFFTGSAVESDATGANADAIISHEYGDQDPEGLPIGLTNSVDTLAWGSGELIVTLRHMAYEEDAPTKTEGLAEDVAAGGFASIPGDNDIQATFNIEVE
ncbi:MAG: hypothetical protein VX899_13715 [Myxococcota bacterium]|nr:hypothetical protein [Myxococcota bacterium]